MIDHRGCAIVAFAVISVTPGFGQYQHSNSGEIGAEHSPFTGELVKTGLYLIPGGGCNTLLRLTANGLIVVDGKRPGNYQALTAYIRKISDQPVRVLINTDHHAERTGNNSGFREGGAQILAQENVVKNLNAGLPLDAKAALPTKTYDRQFNFHLGGIDVQVMHFGNAHTDGDSVVYFPNLKVVAVGDLYVATPNPDYLSGGSLVGWGQVLSEILKLDFDVVVPGSGPTATRADLEAFQKRLETLY
jgi:glyoxylase-like metal-dependent hydrolase (beta-lactamase superfamily II)